LLLLLSALGRKLGFELEVGYFDHMLRGRHAIEQERRFVERLCEHLGVAFHNGSGDVRAHKEKRRLTIEEAARELRYSFLAKTAQRRRCASVATGHTADDQAETVLMNIIRGTGLRGLAAMEASAPLPVRGANARLIRPLLTVSRQETEECCSAVGVNPVEDETNRSKAFRRNRVRHELLPLLRELNPKVDEALARMSNAARESDTALAVLAAGAIEDRDAKRKSLRLSRKTMRVLPAGAQKLVIRSALERLLGTTRSISARHVDAIVGAAGKTGTRLDLPRGLRVEVEREELVLCLGVQKAARRLTHMVLPMPGSTKFGSWTVRTQLLKAPPMDLRSKNGMATALLDASALGGRAWIRPRQPGDRYQPLGMSQPKKLQDVLVDAHVPRSRRDELPLVCTDKGIAWVPGQPPAEWAKVGPGTEQTLRIVAEPVEP
jgi:tRNA(Ile)-lysidine synthase